MESRINLVQDEIYRMKDGSFGQFSRIGGTGMAIFHPYQEPDMQSCWAIDIDRVDRKATTEEAEEFKRQ